MSSRPSLSAVQAVIATAVGCMKTFCAGEGFFADEIMGDHQGHGCFLSPC
jgi:hypothetical protein